MGVLHLKMCHDNALFKFSCLLVDGYPPISGDVGTLPPDPYESHRKMVFYIWSKASHKEPLSFKRWSMSN